MKEESGMKLRKLAVVAAATAMTLAATMTSFAKVSYEDWHYAKFGSYPGGYASDWINDPVYYQYLSENDPESLKKLQETYSDVYGDDDYDSYVDVSTSKASSYAVITSAYWSGSYAKWKTDGVPSKYQVRVYRDGSRITTKDTTSKSVNLSSSITKSGYYYFEVRAYNKTGGWSDWEESDDKYFSASSSSSSSSSSSNGPTATVVNSGGPGTVSNGQWLQAADGSGKWWYKHANGSYTSNNWEQINNKWYYFDAAGWMMTGWLNAGGATYYLGADGTMLTGTNYIDGVYRNFDTSGKLIN